MLVGQPPREPERAYHRVIKTGDRGYPVTAGSDDEQSEGVPELAVWVAQVDRAWARLGADPETRAALSRVEALVSPP